MSEKTEMKKADILRACGNATMTDEGYIQPDEELIREMF